MLFVWVDYVFAVLGLFNCLLVSCTVGGLFCSDFGCGLIVADGVNSVVTFPFVLNVCILLFACFCLVCCLVFCWGVWFGNFGVLL